MSSHRSRQKERIEVVEVSPEIEIAAQDDYVFSGEDDHHDQSFEKDDDDSLNIKPPQPIVKREKSQKKSQKNKESRRREKNERERGNKHSKERGEKERGGASSSSAGAPPPSKERPREDREAPPRSNKPIKEGGRDREAETRRREKSLRERERLERLERERHRIDRERRDRLQRAEREKDRERTDKMDRPRKPEDLRRRLEKSESHRQSKTVDRQNRHERSRSPRRDGRGGREEKPRSRKTSPRHDEQAASHPEHPREDDVEHVEHEDDHHSDVDHHSDLSDVTAEEEMSPGMRSDEDHHRRSPDELSHHSEDNSEMSHSEDEDHRNGSGHHSDKVKSKFDPSDNESETQSVDHSGSEDDYIDDSPEQSPIELKPDLPNYFPAIQGCRSVEEFNCLNRIAEGTYGVVYRAKDKKTGELVALKRLKMEKEKEGFPITSLREINTLLKSQHPNIVTVREIVVGSNMDKIYIVMDYVEHDMKSLMESMKDPFITGEVKTLMIQLLRGVQHLHDNWIIHRDLKTSNLLLGHNGILKIGDFGLAREYGSPLKHYTPIVVTLWYRAPELLLGTKEYSCPIDMWSVGCIFAELITRKPLFPGKSDIDQLNRIFKELGTPNEKIWQGVGELPAMKKCTFTEYPYNQLRNRFGSLLSDKGFDLMNKLLTYNPVRRITAEDALKHEYFSEAPTPVSPSLFPTWPAKSEMTRSRTSHGPSSPKPPSGGKAFAKLMGDDGMEPVQPAPSGAEGGPGGFHLTYASKGAAASGPGFSLKF